MKNNNTITMIAAAAANNALGKDNHLLWHLPDDFKRFKKLTSGHKIIMGRKTFESLDKPLPHREHIIITRQKSYHTHWDDCVVVHSLPEALSLIDQEEAFIIGGGEIYKESMPFSNKIELTRVHANFPEADTYFPPIHLTEWELIMEVYHPKDEKHAYDFTYLTYERK